MSSSPTQYPLDASKMPRFWYNIAADLPSPPPPVLHPGTQQPIGPADLAPLFPMALIEQEMSAQREVPIPDEVRNALAMWRPTPRAPKPAWHSRAAGTLPHSPRTGSAAGPATTRY